MTVGELLRRITSAELTEWIAFYAIEAEAEAKAAERQTPRDPSAQRPP